MKNQILFKGSPVEIAGKFIEVGTSAPDFSLIKTDLSAQTLHALHGKRVVLNIFPSVDTDVCALSVRKFNEVAANLPNTVVLCISKDLPFAQGRFCAAEGIKNVVMLSDFYYQSHFAADYGVLMSSGPLSGLLARSVVIIDIDGKVTYAAKSVDIIQEPDYEQALLALENTK